MFKEPKLKCSHFYFEEKKNEKFHTNRRMVAFFVSEILLFEVEIFVQ